MCSGISFLVGLILLIKGDFRFGIRMVPKARGRLAGLALMTPLVISMCHGMVIGLRAVNAVDLDTLASPSEQMRFLEQVMDSYYEEVLMVQLVALAAAAAAALYLILSSPPGSAAPAPAPSRMANVMTPEEVAAYLRIPEFEVIMLIEDGRLPAARIGGEYRIARIAVEDFLQSQAAAQPRDDDL